MPHSITSSEESGSDDDDSSVSGEDDSEKTFKIEILSEFNVLTEQKFTKDEYKLAIASLQ